MTDQPPLTKAELAAIEAAEQQATSGPWTVETHEIDPGDQHHFVVDRPGHSLADIYAGSEPDAIFVAGSRTWIPRLMSDLKAARAETERLRDRIVVLSAELEEANADSDEIVSLRQAEQYIADIERQLAECRAKEEK